MVYVSKEFHMSMLNNNINHMKFEKISHDEAKEILSNLDTDVIYLNTLPYPKLRCPGWDEEQCVFIHDVDVLIVIPTSEIEPCWICTPGQEVVEIKGNKSTKCLLM